jgi:hypothetical protein
MQAVIRPISGISLEQSRMASPVHIRCASEENAEPADGERATAETAIAKVSASWRVVERVILRVPCRLRFPFLGGAVGGLNAALDD